MKKKSRPRGAPGAAQATDSAVVRLLALMMAAVAALGMPIEDVVQDTAKSALVALLAWLALGRWCWGRRHAGDRVTWHPLLIAPLLLLAHALASMAWSHTYLAGVEAARWAVVAVLMALGVQVLDRERLPVLAWGIHAGASVAALWAVLQFTLDLNWFPQGPQPGSTFFNRNFLAEFLAGSLPWSVWLLWRAGSLRERAVTVLGVGLMGGALLMTGTRSALLACGAVLAVLPLVLWRCRASWWPGRARPAAVASLLALAIASVLASLPTRSAYVVNEHIGTTGWARSLVRAHSLGLGAGDPSIGTRSVMWRDTLRLIAAHPLTGVGAGAWEVQIPRYQSPDNPLENDYYAHNEPLQLVAEYGLLGVGVLLALGGWLLWAAWRSLRPWARDTSAISAADPGHAAHATQVAHVASERSVRAVILCSLLAQGVVSAAGFPWRLAATGALFALSLAALAASDLRWSALNVAQRSGRPPERRHPSRMAGVRLLRSCALPLPVGAARVGLALSALGLLLTVGLTAWAVRAETLLVRANRLALGITATGHPNDPRLAASRREVIRLVREGMALHPHYRKLTPQVADELARWGDWPDAAWVWEGMLASRPHVGALLTNAARARAMQGDLRGAWALYKRARTLQPDAPGVRSLEVNLLMREGREAEALDRVRVALADGRLSRELLVNGQTLAQRAGDEVLAERLRARLARDQMSSSRR